MWPHLRIGAALVLAVAVGSVVVQWQWKAFEPKDHYEALGLSRTATRNLIRKRFNELALIFHPDKVEGATRAASWSTRAWYRLTGYRHRASRRYIRLSEAYHVLKDEGLRATYDQELRAKEARSDRAPGRPFYHLLCVNP